MVLSALDRSSRVPLNFRRRRWSGSRTIKSKSTRLALIRVLYKNDTQAQDMVRYHSPGIATARRRIAWSPVGLSCGNGLNSQLDLRALRAFDFLERKPHVPSTIETVRPVRPPRVACPCLGPIAGFNPSFTRPGDTGS